MSHQNELKYGSVLVYSKHEPKCKDFILGVKGDTSNRFRNPDQSVSVRRYQDVAAGLVKKALQSHPWLENYFNKKTCLVPIPGSGPTTSGYLWAVERLCQSLLNAGIGARVEPLVRRVKRVPKSAYCKPGEARPEPEDHYNSVVIDKVILAGMDITLVDDVITRGSTFVGIHKKLAEAYPGTPIRLFALARNNSVQGAKLFDPHEGIIQRIMGQLSRS